MFAALNAFQTAGGATTIGSQIAFTTAGTYTWTIFDDQGTDDGIVNGTDYSTTLTVVVGATGATATYAATVTVTNSSSVVSGTNGSLVKISLTSGGVAASPDTAGGVKVTLTGSAVVDRVNDGNVDNSTTYILGNGQFNGSGNAWINVTNTVAETVTMTLSGSGSMASSFTAPSANVLTFVAEVASASGPVISKGASLVTSGMLISSPAEVAINPSLYSRMPYDASKDLIPVSKVASAEYSLYLSSALLYLKLGNNHTNFLNISVSIKSILIFYRSLNYFAQPDLDSFLTVLMLYL